MNERFHNEKGLTLVEVLASIVILSIVVTTFLLVFSQTAKTTKQSEEKVDATYVAQTEMENMYEMSQDYTLDETYESLKDDYTRTSKDGWERFEKDNNDENFHITISFNDLDTGMTRVVIEVESTIENDPTKAHMENLYKWKE